MLVGIALLCLKSRHDGLLIIDSLNKCNLGCRQGHNRKQVLISVALATIIEMVLCNGTFFLVEKRQFDQLIWSNWVSPLLDPTISYPMLPRISPNLSKTGCKIQIKHCMCLSLDGNLFPLTEMGLWVISAVWDKTEWTPQWPNWLVCELSKLRSICCVDNKRLLSWLAILHYPHDQVLIPCILLFPCMWVILLPCGLSFLVGFLSHLCGLCWDAAPILGWKWK